MTTLSTPTPVEAAPASPNAGRDISNRRLDLAELAELAGMTARNVRAYQQRGLIDAPVRQGRRAYYTWDHLTRLRIVSALHEHGLTLRMIGDLLARGTADSELVRLGREEMSATWTRSVRVPMAENVAEWVLRNNSSEVEELVANGLMEWHDGKLFANAAGLGISAALSRQELPPDVAVRLALAAVEAARCTEKVLLEECDELAAARGGENRDEVELLLMQFVAVVFADHVHNAVINHRRS